MTTSIRLCAGVLGIVLLVGSEAAATGVWNGQDLYFVPMSWCVVQNSPAQAAPNVAGDFSTDAVIWRRHERPTDNILTPQAGISLRSAINDAWGSFNFPIIMDTDLTASCGAAPCVVDSDIRGEDVNNFGAEFNAIIGACQTAYAAIGKAGIGITAVNLGLYHDATPDYVGIIGWGGCSENLAGNCVVPFNGIIGVIDNHYLHPSVPNRTFPGNNPSTGFSFVLTDPLDSLTGHEVGHALSLDHRNSATALMNPGLADNDFDGQADNIGLNATEVATLRTNALNVPGLEIDPPGEFLPSEWQAMIAPDEIRPREAGAHMDIAGLRIVLNMDTGEAMVGQQLAGLFPKDFDPMQYCFLMDTDGSPDTGAGKEALAEIGFFDPRIEGVELIGCVEVAPGPELRDIGWVCNGQCKREDVLRPDLHTMTLYPHFLPTTSKKQPPLPEDRPHPIHHIVHATLLANALEPKRPFNVQALILGNEEVLDSLEDGGFPFVLEPPTFPHCFPRADALLGEEVLVDFDGLVAGNPYHALIGAIPVANGVADANGEGTAKLPVQLATALGPHLVTIGTDGTALTADCIINVVDPKSCDGDFDGDGDVDATDARRFGTDFGRRDCRVPGEENGQEAL